MQCWMKKKKKSFYVKQEISYEGENFLYDVPEILNCVPMNV